MKNNHVVLLSSLFVSSFSLGMAPDPCYLFIDPFAWATCKVTSNIAWKIASAAASSAASTAVAAAPAAAGMSTSTKIVIGAAALGSIVPKAAQSESAPAPAPAPAKKEEPKPAPAPSSPKRSGITKSEAVAFVGGAGVMLVLEPAVSTAIRLGVEDIYKEATGKRAKEDKQRGEDQALQKEALSIQSRAVAVQEAALELQRKELEDQKKRNAEDMLLHLRASEQNEKILAQGKGFKEDMSKLSKQMSDFAGA